MKLNYLYHEIIDSTNTELKRMALDHAPEGTVVSAGHQTAGRGRSGHAWASPTHDSVATSLLLYPKVNIAHVHRLTIIAAMAVATAMEDLYDLPTEIKWPNDVLIHKKKICGILTEMDAKNNEIQSVVVGIGVNVHQTSFPEDIASKATSIDLELSGKVASRRAITEAIWEHFLKYYEIFLQTEDLSNLLEDYNSRLVNKNREVRILDPLGEYNAISLGIDETGALLVEKEDHTIVPVDSGEVSVRGIYGYA